MISTAPRIAGLCSVLLCSACRSPAPPKSPPAASEDRRPAPKTAVSSSNPAEPTQARPAQAEPSHPTPTSADEALRLSYLPEDTMAVARLTSALDQVQDLAHALDLSPKSLRRSLPLSLRLGLSQLTAPPLTFPFAQHPMAMVWDPKQRLFWLWPQHDLSLNARRTLEKKLGAPTQFSPPYWIFERPENPLVYAVHTRTGWLLAAPKAWIFELLAWLKDSRLKHLGRLPWAPREALDIPLLVKWRGPQVLESAPEAPLPVIGELRFAPRLGVQVNGGHRDQP